MLIDQINQRRGGMVVYGITPPKKQTPPEKVAAIAARQVARLRDLDLDGLILYDIQDEQSRTAETRPFPFLETLDAFNYAQTYLQALRIPKIIYRAVGKYSSAELSHFLTSAAPTSTLTVFVGAASREQTVTMSMGDAYDLRGRTNSQLLLGGVTIPERHQSKGDEHQRVFHKMAQGCSFFVSQGVYDITASKNFLSDYYYFGQENGVELAPILFTLIHSHDILEKSVDLSERAWRELKAFADEKGIPIGCNIESVAIRKVEIDASIELLKRVRAI